MLLSIPRFVLFAFLIFLPAGASAENSAPKAAPPSQQLLSPEELEALLAPIALYPDTLLSLTLMASTYPLEVVQAERWVTQNAALKGDQLKAAVDKQPWDESVRSLAATPAVLTMMSTQLDWTRKLGDATLAQEADVLDAVQRLRSKAYANKTLQSNKQQSVSVSTVTGGSGGAAPTQPASPPQGQPQPTQAQPRQVIAIAPTEPNTVYVPYYNPSVVYGAWPYPAYPAYYWPAPGYIAGGVLATGLAFGAGYALGRWASGGNYWGGGANWGNRNLVVNRPVNINNIGNNFQHRPEHRHGVRYNNSNVAQKYGGNRTGGGQARSDFRGHSGAAKAGQQPGAGQGQGKGGGQQGKAGQQPGAGKGQGKGGGQQGKAGQQPGAGKGGGMGQQAKAGQQPATGKGGGMGQAKAGQQPATGKGQAKGGGMGQQGAGGMGQARPSPGAGGGPRRDAAFGNIGSGNSARQHSQRGHASFAQGGGGRGVSAGGGGRGGGFSGGGRGGGGRGGGGGGRRSDAELKHNVSLLGYLDSGLGYYRFEYIGNRTAYVGVMAQEVQAVLPSAVARGRDGYLRVFYDQLGLTFQTYDQWVASGAQMPPVTLRH